MAKRNLKGKKSRTKILVTIIIVIFVFMLIISLPVFFIEDVQIIGNENLTDEYIISVTGIEKGKNIFYINKYKARKNLLKNAYSKNVKIKTTLPNSIIIEIEERKVRGYVKFESLGNYLLIDKDGRVLDVKANMPQKLPVIVGLKIIGSFTVGDILNVSNEAEFEIVIKLSQLLEKNDILDIVDVDVTNRSDIRLYINDTEFKFGEFVNAYEKVVIMKAILEKWSNARGTVDISDISKDPVFEYLT